MDKPEIVSRPLPVGGRRAASESGALSRAATVGATVVDNQEAPPTQTQEDMVGETVWYHPSDADGLAYQAKRMAAIITDVHAHDEVDLLILPPGMSPQPRMAVPHIGSQFAADTDPVWEHRSRILQSKL